MINKSDIDKFNFRDLHNRIRIGTASDRYVGWIGQIYTRGKYHISKRNKVGNKFTNPEHCIVRLITPIGMRYDETYIKAFPFDKMVEGMLQPEMIAETKALMRTAIEKAAKMSIIVNNRAGGNAPLIARELVDYYRRWVQRLDYRRLQL